MKTKILVIAMVFLGCLLVSSSVNAAGYYTAGTSGAWEISSFPGVAYPYSTVVVGDIGMGTTMPAHIVSPPDANWPKRMDLDFSITPIQEVGPYKLTIRTHTYAGEYERGSISINGSVVSSFVESNWSSVDGSAGRTNGVDAILVVDNIPVSLGSNTLTISLLQSPNSTYDGGYASYLNIYPLSGCDWCWFWSINPVNIKLERSFTPDYAGPVVTFPVNPVLSWFGESVTITPTVTDAHPPITYLWSDGSTASSITIDYVLSGMDETFTLTATDALGNVGSPASVTVKDQSDLALQNLIDLLPRGLLNPNTSR